MASKDTKVDAGTPKLTVPEVLFGLAAVQLDVHASGVHSLLPTFSQQTAVMGVKLAGPAIVASGGLSALYTYNTLNNPRMAGIKAALGVAYLWAGRQLVTGNPTLGYDVGSIASLALVGVAGPRAQATQEMSAVAMAALGGISSVSNIIKSYEMRTGKPKEMGYDRS